MKTWHVNDVMTTDVVSAGPDTPYRELVELMAARHVDALPVVDGERRVLGVVSRTDLLQKIEFAGAGEPHWFERRPRAQWRKAAGLVAEDLMTSPAVVALSTTAVRAAARRMDEACVRQLPVEDPLGRLIGIVSRGDLLKEHLRPDPEILTDVRAAIAEALSGEDPAAVAGSVRQGVVTLTGRAARWSSAARAARLVRLVPGVVDVADRVTFECDDRRTADTSPVYFVA